MNFLIRVPLNTSAEQHARLCELRAVFARVCNELAPQVQQSKVWNRVALHHLHYRGLREKFPALGSQMVCNAIYAVSKMGRLIYQHPSSPYNVSLRAGLALPLLKFADSCPVYFDRHTLSIKPGQLSLFTMDGRMRFDLTLEADKLALFEQTKLREIVLNERIDRVFELSFHLATTDSPDPAVDGDVPEVLSDANTALNAAIPEYVSVEIAS
jgi:hypothetical protein